ncbi:hypothetical protein [Neisseria sp. Ec49-e6-T10]|uniref:hypothetical protein n=1 Tax=Neisseria sp. Ec49-e6-T10 TaxID=3140744 RepID=UPI003EBFCDB5
MIRNGTYTTYMGKEYKIGETILENEPIKYWIKSMDPKELENGFYLYERPKTMIIKGVEYELPPREKGSPNVYLKEIDPSEINEVYDISPYAIYKGHRFGINSENETDYYLGTGDTALAKALGFEMIDREVYRKWVPKEDMEKVYEVKTPMPNFFK